MHSRVRERLGRLIQKGSTVSAMAGLEGEASSVRTK